MTPIESYWDSQMSTLRDVHDTFSPDNKYKPLPDRHPLLQSGHQRSNRNGQPRPRRKPDKISYDSWEEDSEDSDGTSEMFTYPMVMYPMIMAPHPNVSSQKFKAHKHPKASRKKLKKVHYRNTPEFLNSRENTKYEPREWTDTRKDADEHNSDPFDPRSNSVLARYQVADVQDPYPYRAQPHMEYNSARSGDNRGTNMGNKPSPTPQFISPVPVDHYVADIIEDAILPEIDDIVRDTTQQLVSDHMEKAAVYDDIVDMVNDITQQIGPQLVEESIVDVVIEDLIDDEIVDVALWSETKDIAMEVLSHYSDKVRERDIREINKTTCVPLQDSMCLDYLLEQIIRQGQLWTEGEHANKLLDELLLSMVTSEYLNVAGKRRKTILNKPIRRYFEKNVTDVVFDKLLEDLSLNLDEDMADLDEYERGVDILV